MFYCNRLREAFLSFFILLSFTIHAQNETFTMTQIGPNNLLNKPWDLNYGPDGYLWITEEAGKVVRVDPTTGTRDELLTISDAYTTGGQDGLVGFAFDSGFTTGSPYLYLSYTYLNSSILKQRLVRYTYSLNGNNGSLSSPSILIDNLPASNDHNSGRLVLGGDSKIYYTIGDQANKNCGTNLAQFLPTQLEIGAKNWKNYPGKTLRINTDGSIPADNPVINGVRSHIYSYGHRNAQGLVFGSNGILYADEHGPNSDDELNIINPGKNYGWPYVAGLNDNLHDAPVCTASGENSFVAANSNYQDPVMSLFITTTKDNTCTDAAGSGWQCRTNIAPSSLAIYESTAIPSWQNSLLLTSLKKGRIYRLKLSADGTTVDQTNVTQFFYTQNRYRDIVVAPDGKTFYIITDSSGKTSDALGVTTTSNVLNPGAILKFTLIPSLSINSVETENFFKIWPNPASHKLFIDINDGAEIVDFKAQLINTLGQVVKEFTDLKKGVNETKIDDLPAGIYILKLYSTNNSWQKNVIIN